MFYRICFTGEHVLEEEMSYWETRLTGGQSHWGTCLTDGHVLLGDMSYMRTCGTERHVSQNYFSYRRTCLKGRCLIGRNFLRLGIHVSEVELYPGEHVFMQDLSYWRTYLTGHILQVSLEIILRDYKYYRRTYLTEGHFFGERIIRPILMGGHVLKEYMSYR